MCVCVCVCVCLGGVVSRCGHALSCVWGGGRCEGVTHIGVT